MRGSLLTRKRNLISRLEYELRKEISDIIFSGYNLRKSLSIRNFYRDLQCSVSLECRFSEVCRYESSSSEVFLGVRPTRGYLTVNDLGNPLDILHMGNYDKTKLVNILFLI